MSQNSNTLLLFFDKEVLHKNCLLMFLKLAKSENEQASVYGGRLKVDISNTWNEHWFNQSVTAQPHFIQINFDSSTSSHLPLDELKKLFACGLKGAAIEIFFDQVGEYEQHFFVDGQLVEKTTLIEHHSSTEQVIQTQFEHNSEDLEDSHQGDPSPIDQLIDNNNQQHDDAQKLVNSIVELAKVSRETGTKPDEILKGALVLRGLGKGLLQAFGFGVVTVLLFKGIWLWITLSIFLAIALPLYYVSQVSSEFDDDDDQISNEENGESTEKKEASGETECNEEISRKETGEKTC